jgi:hypothetical protein
VTNHADRGINAADEGAHNVERDPFVQVSDRAGDENTASGHAEPGRKPAVGSAALRLGIHQVSISLRFLGRKRDSGLVDRLSLQR